jgi:hypothetical protein
VASCSTISLNVLWIIFLGPSVKTMQKVKELDLLETQHLLTFNNVNLIFTLNPYLAVVF